MSTWKAHIKRLGIVLTVTPRERQHITTVRNQKRRLDAIHAAIPKTDGRPRLVKKQNASTDINR